MSLYSFTYTLHHVLLLKLIANFPFDRARTLHNFLFLAAANTPAAERIGINYEFYRGAASVYSFEIQGFLTDLKRGALLQTDTLALTKEGRDFYYQVASLLRYERFPAYCMNLAAQYQHNLWRVNHEIIFHPLFRKCKVGRKISLPAL
ncbi:MAG TPA: hypothetical protein DCE00_05940 [Firmicutes bacterium]|nr:hypothetical protein [Bacillota bacterium]HAA38396.1 hypothetical protein [Bacillota bacterium]